MRIRKKLAVVLLAAIMAGTTTVPFAPVEVYAGLQEQQEFENVVTDVNQKNKKINAPKGSLDRYRYDFSNKKPKMTNQDVAIVKNYDKKKVKKSISVATAKKEVNWLFRVLRSQYGLYTYYGGDAKFEKQQKAILKRLGTKGTVTTKKYQQILHKYLGFVVDEHFYIGEQNFSANVALFSNESTHYTKENKNYYKGNNKVPIVTINGKKPDVYLKRAIDENGNLTYYPYVMLKKKDSYTYTVKYQNGTSEKITLKPALFSYKNTVNRLYGYDRFTNGAYIELNTVFADDGGNMTKERNRFLADVPDMKKQKNLVIDLRSNGGGDLGLIEAWFKTYTGQAPQWNFNTLRIRPTKLSDPKMMDLYMSGMGLKRSGNYYYQYPTEQYLENDNHNIFVLTSRYTASAAEGYTDVLKNLENVVTIGTNTGGVLSNMANYFFAMPYSGLFIQFGECLIQFDSSYFKESYGMEPDIYLTGRDLDTRLKKFFEIYVEN